MSDLEALDLEIATTYGAIHAPDNLAEILAKHGWVNGTIDDLDALLIQRALEAIPVECRYHGASLNRDPGEYLSGPCCDTGRPSLYRRYAEAALKRVRGGE